MPASVSIVTAEDGAPVQLSETFIPDDPSSLGMGKETRVAIMNTGTTLLREIEVSMDGTVGNNIQLAIDTDGQPGAWTDTNGSLVFSAEVKPTEAVYFWARPCYTVEDLEGLKQGQFILRAISA